jgi:hypothetical protein
MKRLHLFIILIGFVYQSASAQSIKEDKDIVSIDKVPYCKLKKTNIIR